MKLEATRGSALVKGIVALLIAALLALAGYIFYDMQQDDDDITNNVNDTQQQVDETTNDQTQEDETQNWLLYEAPNYTIRFADGWELMQKQSGEGSFVALDNEDLRPEPGEQAVVSEYDPSAPSEFVYGLAIDYLQPRQGSCTEFYGFSGQEAFTSEGDYPIYKEVEQAGDAEAENLSEGDQRYNYCVEMPESVIVMSYTVEAGDEDYYQTVEEVAATVQ